MRRALAATALAAPLGAALLTPAGAGATTTSPFDAANLRGACSALELTVKTGYSFVVEPDAQVPRAGTSVQEGQSEAIASPADPGDSVDGLAALGIPQAEGYLVNGYPGAPSPFAGKGLGTLPKPLDSVGQTLLTNPLNPALTFPYEHADAGYPNPQSPGTQTATLAGTPQATYADPSGILSIDAATATSTAGDGLAVADSGAGAATAGTVPGVPVGVASLPAFGVSVGRVAAHSEAHVLATKVTEDATCTLHDVEVAVPGSAALHIGAVVAQVHAERDLGAPTAVASEAIEFAGVTLNGQGATLDQAGLHAGGHTITTLPSGGTPAPPLPPGTPVPPPPTVTVAGSQVSISHPSADEAVVAATGATITLASTTPVPNAIPPTGVSNTPTVYTLTVGNLAAEAYGLAASPPASGLGSVANGVAGTLGGGLGAIGGVPGAAATQTSHPGHHGTPATLASILVAPWQRVVVLVVSSLLEGLLLAWVARNYLRARRRVAAPIETTDLP